MNKKILNIIFIICFISINYAHAKDGNNKEEIQYFTIIHAGTLMAIAGDGILSEQSVIIQGDKIIDVKSSYVTSVGDENSTITIIDLKDKFVMAGLMDMHVHLTMTSGANNNSADYALAGVSNAYKTLMVGFTTVRDLGAEDETIFKLRKSINDGDIIGPRILAAGSIIGVGGRENGKECNGVESCRRTTRDIITSGADWVKIYASCSGGQLCSNKNGPPVFFNDEIDAITTVAKKYGIKVAAHSHPRDSALMVLKYGVSSIEHGSYVNEEAMDIMIKNGVFLIPTVSVLDMLEERVMIPDLSEIRSAHIQSILDTNPNTIYKAYKMGVKIATGTDAGIVPHGKNFREIERFVELGMTNADALKAATINGADLIDMSDELGTIEAGKTADIIAVSGNPLMKIKDIENVTFVMKSGIVFKK